jgi:hypothetical protein
MHVFEWCKGFWDGHENLSLIRAFSGRQPLKMWEALASFREVVAGDHRMILI